jgi:hypothetical protein
MDANAADSSPEASTGSLTVVVHRWLDVFFEWAMWFLIALIAIPAITGAVALIADRSQLVTARVWADRPVLLQAAGLANQWSNGTPSSDADALLTELVGSDWFVDQVLTDSAASFKGVAPDQKAQERTVMRQSLKHTTIGNNVLELSYLTDRPTVGSGLLNSVIVRLGDSIETLESIQTTAAVGLLDGEVAAARATMQKALDAASSYAAGKSLPQLLGDAHYLTLQADALAATQYYVSLDRQAQQAHLAQSALPSIRNSIFRVMDPPSVTPKHIDLHSVAVKYGMEALAGIAALEFVIIYLIGLRDPRIRSGEEVRKKLGVPYLGSTPDLRSAA